MNGGDETIALIRDLARLMGRVRPSALKPQSGDEADFHVEAKRIEERADELLFGNPPSEA